MEAGISGLSKRIQKAFNTSAELRSALALIKIIETLNSNTNVQGA